MQRNQTICDGCKQDITGDSNAKYQLIVTRWTKPDGAKIVHLDLCTSCAVTRPVPSLLP